MSDIIMNCERCGKDVRDSMYTIDVQKYSTIPDYYDVCSDCFSEYRELVRKMMDMGPGTGFVTIAEESLANMLGECCSCNTSSSEHSAGKSLAAPASTLKEKGD